MARMKLRESIAKEAARLVLRRKESDFGTARQLAARWLSRKKVDSDDLPTFAEIQTQLYALAGFLGDELQTAELSSTGAATGDVDATAASEHQYHPDAFSVFRMLLVRLEAVRLNPQRHPEGDALYHSLQTFEQGILEKPYDEEFLLACLLHDAGLAIDRRHPARAVLEFLGDLLTARTCYLIEHRQDAREYLKTGKIARSIRRSEHFEDVRLLAHCDLAARVPGASVRSLDEALETIKGLEASWDDV